MGKSLSRRQKIENLYNDFEFSIEKKLDLFAKTKHVPNLLPDLNSDLDAMLERIIPLDVPVSTNKKRRPYEEQINDMRYEFRGQSEVIFNIMWCIVYIRRKNEPFGHALELFFKIMDAHGEFISMELSPRYLMSILKTFADYGRNDREKFFAISAFNYASLIRCYETERMLDGLSAKEATFELPIDPELITRTLPTGRYLPGHDDGASSINLLLLMEIQPDDPVSYCVQALLAEVKYMKTVFSRVDKEMLKKPQYEKKFGAYGFGKPKSK